MPALTRAFCRCALGLLSLVLLVQTANAQATKPAESERARALRLNSQLKNLEALPLLENLFKANPEDDDVAQALAEALVTQAPTLPVDDRPKGLIRARGILEKLDSRGAKLSDLNRFYLTYLPADGKFPEFSNRADVDAAMAAGEADFSRRSFEKARAHYLRAFALEPSNATAALFVGDTYFAAGNSQEAAKWFARATRIDPNKMAAWRYWGDALSRLGKQGEAREKYFEAILTDPYQMPGWMSLSQWARRNKVPMVHPKVMPDDLAPKTDRKPSVDDGTIHVSLYEKRRAEWRERRFKATFPDKKYRHTLVEEADALRAVATAITADEKAGKIKKLDPALKTLVEIESRGLMEAFVLFERPDDEIAADYLQYRQDHADKLLDYLKAYVATFDTKPK